MNLTGHLRKMHAALDNPVRYALPLDDERVALNELIGQRLTLEYRNEIHCIHCGRKTNKSFNQGYCYPCFRDRAECDRCIVKPEQCHYFAGTCRDPGWGEQHCLQEHYVYLANSSGIKVGITRGSQLPTRWLDQGAVQALPIFRVRNRLLSGLVEVVLKQHVADKTAWQRMLKGEPEPRDLAQKRDELYALGEEGIADILVRHGDDAIQMLGDEQPIEIHYPVREYPGKVSALNFDKTPVISGVLQGIKGQYLIFDCGVLNIRKFAGYHVSLSA